MTKKEYQRQWYLAHAESERKKARERMRVYAPKHREEKREYDKKYLNSEKGRAKIYARVKAYSSTKIGAFKNRARYAVSNAIRDGKLQRMSCEVCNKPNAHAHHKDYSKPFDIVWLCRKHHIQLHRGVLLY